MGKLSDIMALVNAGFSKADIMALVSDKEPEKEPEKKQEPENDKGFIPRNDNADVKALFDSIGMKIEGLTNAIQKSNLNAGGATPEETVDTILASIINPPT